MRAPVHATRYVAGHADPRVARFEVPVYGDHVDAWPVDRVDLAALRAGLIELHCSGDGRGLDALWARLRPGYELARGRRRWRVPGDTFAAAFMAGRLAWARLDVADRPEWLTEKVDADELEARLRQGVEGRAHDVSPARWFDVETWLTTARASTLPSLHTPMLVNALLDVHQPVRDLDFPGPDGDQRWLSRLRFRAEAGDREVAAEDLPNRMRDLVLDGGGEAVGTPHGIVEDLHGAIGLAWLVDALVGPWTPSAGPGPCFDLRGRPLLDLDIATVLPLFRAGTRADPDGEALLLRSPWEVLVGEDLRTAIDLVRGAVPGGVRHDVQDDEAAGVAGGPWWATAPQREIARAFPVMRARTLHLLERAHAEHQAVLLLPRAPSANDHPRDIRDGELVAL